MNKKAFTLLELVVVMSIIIIISTIITLAFGDYLVGVRDSNRITQISNMRDGVALNLSNGGTLKPEGSIEIQFDGVKQSYQGYFGPSLIKKIGYSMDGIDPSDQSYFTYTMSADGKYFQLMTFLESEKSFIDVGYEKALLKDNNDKVPFIVGSKEIGIFFNSDVVPVHEYESSPLNIISSDSTDYNVLLRNDKIVSSSGSTLFAEIENVIANYGDNIYSCATQPYLYANYTIGNPKVSNTPWQNVNSAEPCYFSCKNGFVWNLSQCEPDVATKTVSCTGLVANALWNTATQVDQLWNTAAGDYLPSNIGTYNDTPSATECRFKCPTNYTYNGSACIPNTQNGICTGLLANASWNSVNNITQTWNGSSWAPSLTGQYNTTPSTTNCRYNCNTNYTYNGSACIADTQNGNCIGNPINSTWHQSSITQTWNGSAWSPTLTGQFSLTAVANECKFNCNTNYTWNSGTSTCDADTQVVACTGLPANATANTVSSITQTWNGTAFLPSSVYTNNATSSLTECRFTCDAGYAWNGTICAVSPVGQFKLVLTNKCGVAAATFDANFNTTTGVYTGDINCASSGLVNTDLDKFTPLVRVTGYLDLSGNSITNVTGLISLKSVGTNLKLNNNSLTSISNLTLLNSVPNLYLNNNPGLSSLTGIQSITNLSTIDISNNALVNLSGISGLTSLTQIKANNNSINDITGLSSLNSVSILNLSYNSISTITSLSGKTNIKELYLNNNSITSISTLSTLLTDKLYIYGNASISDLSPLNGYNSNVKILALDNRTYTTKISALSTVCINWDIKNESLSTFADITKICKPAAGSYANLEGNSLGDWYPGIGTNTNGAAYGWYFDTDYTPSSNTGPNKGYDGNTYLFVETSNTPGVGYSNKTSYLVYDITDTSNFVNFYYHAYGVNIGTMRLQTYNGSTWTTRHTISGQQHTSYTQAWTKTPDITIPAGTTKIRLYYTSGSGYQGDFAIDALTVGEK